jgi:hypothetical protein
MCILCLGFLVHRIGMSLLFLVCILVLHIVFFGFRFGSYFLVCPCFILGEVIFKFLGLLFVELLLCFQNIDF